MHFVTGQMVCDRHSPGATILGVEVVYFLRQQSRVGPADRLCTSWCILVWTVYEMAGPVRSDGFTFRFAVYDVAASLWPAVAAAAKKASIQRGVARPLFLGSKKQRVVNIVTDGWLATAGLQSG